MSDFIARFQIRDGADGFSACKLIFDDSGVVAVPTRHDESIDRATIVIHWYPNSEILNGEIFEAECSVLVSDYWKDKMVIGYKFTVGFQSDVAGAEIVRLL